MRWIMVFWVSCFVLAIYLNECVQIYIMGTKKVGLYDPRKIYLFCFLKGVSNLNVKIIFLSFTLKEERSQFWNWHPHTQSWLISKGAYVIVNPPFNAKKVLLLEIVLLAHSQYISISIPANSREIRVANRWEK